jgi:hypothetical protein
LLGLETRIEDDAMLRVLVRFLGTPEQVQRVTVLVSEYIAAQRERFYRQAVPLAARQKAAVAGFFEPQVLDAVRVAALDGLRVENPPFYPMLAGMGFSNLPDFGLMAAITFSDVIVSHGPLRDVALFHELVHVEQYRQLGIQRFAELYVRGFLSGEDYDGIPLEANAYALDHRFEINPRQPFSVADEVARWSWRKGLSGMGVRADARLFIPLGRLL